MRTTVVWVYTSSRWVFYYIDLRRIKCLNVFSTPHKITGQRQRPQFCRSIFTPKTHSHIGRLGDKRHLEQNDYSLLGKRTLLFIARHDFRKYEFYYSSRMYLVSNRVKLYLPIGKLAENLLERSSNDLRISKSRRRTEKIRPEVHESRILKRFFFIFQSVSGDRRWNLSSSKWFVQIVTRCLNERSIYTRIRGFSELLSVVKRVSTTTSII